MTVVLLAGASGVVGRRIADILMRELPTVQLISASRRGSVSFGGGARRLDIRNEESVKAALDGVGILVNAVGPYRYDPTPVIRACCETGAHYVDLAEFPEFICKSSEAVSSADSSKSCVLSGCSTSPGLLELLAQWAKKYTMTRVDAWLSMGTRNPVSAALIYGLLRPLGRPCPSGTPAFGESEVRRNRFGESFIYGRYPVPRRGELVEIDGEKVPLRFFVGFDRSLWTRLLVLFALRFSKISDEGLSKVSRALLPVVRLLRLFGGRSGELYLEAIDGTEHVVSSIRVCVHRDGLDVPTAPIIWVVSEFHRRGGLPAGTQRLMDVVSFERAIEGLCAVGCEVTVLPETDRVLA